MWKYSEFDAYDSVNLHDCRVDSIEICGGDLIFNFPNGFRLVPGSRLNSQNIGLKTGQAQVCFHGIPDPFVSIDIFKPTRIFGKTIFYRRLQPESSEFLKMFATGKYELEFITEYHSSMDSLYQCVLWGKGSAITNDCQFVIFTKSIEYRWNETFDDPEFYCGNESL